MHSLPFFLHALSPVHVGVGQAIGVVDLPIQREKATHLPYVPGSGLKGVLRDEFKDPAIQKTLFGPDRINENDKAHAGALAFGDAHLLILPVRSLVGVVAFATSPFLLSRYAQAARRGEVVVDVPSIDLPVKEEEGWVTKDCSLSLNNQVVLEDADVSVMECEAAQNWAVHLAERLHEKEFRPHFTRRFIIVSDSVLSYLADTGTDVRARVRIDDARQTVEQGALWYEENLPAESVLFGLVGLDIARDGTNLNVEQTFRATMGSEKLVQVGGKATIGRGLVRFIL
ncbi:MAG: type III-B CRISPR module RAMP protein Cmr4 [bacterium]|nr:type III-B CRISPR module RAMP protein Cmr4 [bacterium]